MRTTLLWWLGDKFEDGLPHGWQSRLRRWTVDSFFRSRCFEPAILKEGVGDHCHERMPMQALPGSTERYSWCWVKPEVASHYLRKSHCNVPEIIAEGGNPPRLVRLIQIKVPIYQPCHKFIEGRSLL